MALLQCALCRETAHFGRAKTNVSVQRGSAPAVVGQAGPAEKADVCVRVCVHVCAGVSLCAPCIPEIWGCAWFPREAMETAPGRKGV